MFSRLNNQGMALGHSIDNSRPPIYKSPWLEIMENTKKSLVPSLERGFAIMECLAKTNGGLNLSQIARILKLPKSSVCCLLGTLQSLGYVYRSHNSGRYRVSLRVCTLAQMALSEISLVDLARPHLRRLAESISLTTHMATLMEDGSCVLIEKISPPRVPHVATWIGKHLSLHCTALGKAVAAYLPERELDALIRQHGLLRHNDNTICTARRLKQELATVRERGYALDEEEEEINMRCVGAPVFGCTSKPIAALSVVGTVSQLSAGNINHVARYVVAFAREISVMLREQHSLDNYHNYSLESDISKRAELLPKHLVDSIDAGQMLQN
jgi:DNA-binding IclR family transcriptional regulator